MQKITKISSLILAVGSLLLLNNYSARAKSVDNFYFESMHTNYYLDKDNEGRSILKLSETLEPVFPDFDQNRGIVRLIPLKYQKHGLDFKLESIFRDGQPAPIYKNEVQDGHQKLTIRDAHANSYLHGKHSYQINYRLRDVTHKPNDAKIDEFYWDVNGNAWGQSFKKVSATIKLSESIYKQLLKQNLHCYTGRLRSNAKNCTIHLDETNRTIRVATNRALSPKEGLTFAIGFQAGTFAAYQKTTLENLLEIATYAGNLLVLGLGVFSLIFLHKLKAAAKVPQPIVTQFIPPTHSNIYFSSNVLSANGINPKVMSAGLIDLAVRHKIKIKELDNSGFLSGKRYEFEIINDNLNKEDQRFLRLFFKDLTIGKKYTTRKNDYSLGKKVNEYHILLPKLLQKEGLYVDNKKASTTSQTLASLTILAGILMIFGGQAISLEVMPALTIGGMALAGLSFAISSKKRLSEQGAKLKGYLLGLKRYIEAAETERLKFSQSVENAERSIEKDLSDEEKTVSRRIVLYERILPYAILFGLEKSWGKELEKLYATEPDYNPSWYVGAQAFNSTKFIQSVSSFSSSVSSYSSSSSGSSGGGFSGGGGGGGGGGGC